MYELLVLLGPLDHKEKQTNNSLNYYNKIKRDFGYVCNIIKLTHLQSIKSILNKYLNSY